MFSEMYSRYYDMFNRDKNYKKEIEFIYKWAGKPKRILDIGCGTANYWKFYPEDVFLKGIEISEKMIECSIYKDSIQHSEIGNFKGIKGHYGLATALFNVINYLGDNSWWYKLPMFSGSYFIFDIWDKKKIVKERFMPTVKQGENGILRCITPSKYDGKSVNLEITVLAEDGLKFTEHHTMYIYSHEDIERFCGDEFEIVEVKETRRWQTWYKLRKK